MPSPKSIRTTWPVKGTGPKPSWCGWREYFRRLSITARLAFAVAALLAVIYLFFAEENWRGRRAWEICRQELQAKAVELDWKKFVPPPVAADENFAETPFLAPLFDFNPKPRGPGQTIWRDTVGHDRAANFAAVLVPIDKQGKISSTRLDGKMIDLEGSFALLQSQPSRSAGSSHAFATRAEAAAAVLGALQEYEPVLDELRLASRRTHSRFNIDYEAEDPLSILLPHYLVLQRVCTVLEVRASAELALQKIGPAFADVQLMLYLVGSTRGEPFLMAVRSQGSMLKRSEQIIWEGLAGRHWTEAQLEWIEMQLKSNRALEELERDLHAERAAFGEKVFRYIRAHKNVLRNWIASTDEATQLMYLLAGPSGWFYQEQVSYHRLYDAHVLAGLEACAGRVHPGIIDEKQKALQYQLQHSSFWHHLGFSTLLLGPLPKTIHRAAVDQNFTDQTMIACALERYRLENAKYPPTLEALSPRFVDRLPSDVCTGRPLKYRLLQDGRFLLYGVGWNESDDGGVMVLEQDGTNNNADKGDWVWPPYPER